MARRLGNKLKDTGIWAEYEDGAELNIGRGGTAEYQDYLQRLQRPHQKQIDRGTFPTSKSMLLHYKAVAKMIVLDWRNFEDENGKPVPYTEEALVEEMSKDVDLFNFIAEVAGDNSNYAIKAEQKTAKKSTKPQSG